VTWCTELIGVAVGEVLDLVIPIDSRRAMTRAPQRRTASIFVRSFSGIGISR